MEELVKKEKTAEEQKALDNPALDEKGVPLANRMREFERKMQERYEKELGETRRELQELKSSFQSEEAAPQGQPEEAAKAELMEFVKNPKGFMQTTWRETEFQRQIPEAETWIKSQKGYTSDDDAAIFQIIKENKLDTPYHTPMERAKTAWRLLSAERQEKKFSALDDEKKREDEALRSQPEGMGLSTPKQPAVTRQDVIRKLAEAEAKGDLDAAIKYMSLLEDIR